MDQIKDGLVPLSGFSFRRMDSWARDTCEMLSAEIRLSSGRERIKLGRARMLIAELINASHYPGREVTFRKMERNIKKALAEVEESV